MSDGIKLDPPGLALGAVASTHDARLDNMLAATVANIAARHDAGATDSELDDAKALVHALTGWITARAGLVAIREVVEDGDDEIDCAELLEIVSEGLALPGF